MWPYFHKEIWPFCSLCPRLKSNTDKTTLNLNKKIVLLPPDSGSHRSIGNPVKIRGYARSCEFRNVLPAPTSLLFYREDAGSGTSQKTCPFPCPQLSGTKAWKL